MHSTGRRGEAHAVRPDGGCAASPCLAAGAAALLRLRRVDAVKADTLRPNLERIAVGDDRHA